MIKSVGLGKKRNGLSHEESCRYHREVHAPTARRLLAPRGLKKYVGYYVDEAYSLMGGRLPELPWDRVVFEWLTDELWKEMWEWRKTDPEGIDLAADEKRYGDGQAGTMLLCQENVIVSSEPGSAGVSIIDLARKRDGMSHEECVKYHREVHAPAIARLLGSRLKNYVAYYVDSALSMAAGAMANPPYDIVVIAQLDKEFWKGMETRQKNPEDSEIAKDEEHFIDRKSSALLVCQETVFIPYKE